MDVPQGDSEESARPGPCGSVVIPAHNEASVIARCLEALLDGISPAELEVTVVCNGCTDDTAVRARTTSPLVTVVELSEASKPAALRAGDRASTAFPRIYLDADIVLPARAARLLLGALRTGPHLAVRPAVRYDTRRSSAVVRSYYRARGRLPTMRQHLWGAGTYGLSRDGRARFADYPDLVADDLFVDGLFNPDEKTVVSDAVVVVTAPSRLRGLLAILRRTYRGNAEQRSLNPEHAPSSRGTVSDLRRLAGSSPLALLDALTYGICSVSGRVLAHASSSVRWERDESSRTG